MNARRGFLALVGASLVSGTILRRAEAKPTLILPSSPALIQAPMTGIYPLLEAEQSQMHAFIRVKGALPDDMYLDWLEGGLRLAKGAEPGGLIYRALQAEGRIAP